MAFNTMFLMPLHVRKRTRINNRGRGAITRSLVLTKVGIATNIARGNHVLW